MCTSCPVQFRGQTGQLFYFTKCLKSYLSCFCIKAITATISTHKSHIQLNASKVTILPPPHARQAVFIPSCAVQNSVTTLQFVFYHISHNTDVQVQLQQCRILSCKTEKQGTFLRSQSQKVPYIIILISFPNLVYQFTQIYNYLFINSNIK